MVPANYLIAANILTTTNFLETAQMTYGDGSGTGGFGWPEH
jgi:hypothetical protein